MPLWGDGPLDDAGSENFNKITPEMVQNFEDHPDVVASCENLSRQLRQAIADLPGRA